MSLALSESVSLNVGFIHRTDFNRSAAAADDFLPILLIITNLCTRTTSPAPFQIKKIRFPNLWRRFIYSLADERVGELIWFHTFSQKHQTVTTTFGSIHILFLASLCFYCVSGGILAFSRRFHIIRISYKYFSFVNPFCVCLLNIFDGKISLHSNANEIEKEFIEADRKMRIWCWIVVNMSDWFLSRNSGSIGLQDGNKIFDSNSDGTQAAFHWCTIHKSPRTTNTHDWPTPHVNEQRF